MFLLSRWPLISSQDVCHRFWDSEIKHSLVSGIGAVRSFRMLIERFLGPLE